jgi:hypothetical protein
VWRAEQLPEITVEIHNKQVHVVQLASRISLELRARASSESDRKYERDRYWAPLPFSEGKGARELSVNPSKRLRKSFSLDELKWGTAIQANWPSRALREVVPAGDYDVWVECSYAGSTLKSPEVSITITD